MKTKTFMGLTLTFRPEQELWSTGYARYPWVSLSVVDGTWRARMYMPGRLEIVSVGPSERAVRAKMVKGIRELKESIRRLKI